MIKFYVQYVVRWEMPISDVPPLGESVFHQDCRNKDDMVDVVKRLDGTAALNVTIYKISGGPLKERK